MKIVSHTMNSSAARMSIIVGLVVTLGVLVAGLSVTLSTQRTWTAESVVVVLPKAELDQSSTAAYYETLSRGQIVATFAEMSANIRFQQEAVNRLGLSAAQRESVDSQVSVVPDTSVLLVRVSAADPDVAENVADEITAASAAYLGDLSEPYRTSLVHDAQDSAYVSSTAPGLLLAGAAVVALAAGLALQQAVYHLVVALRRPGRRSLSLTRPREVA